nr:uncharacterized protein LOC117276389 [Nicotiana tomentosiformis]
MARKAKIGTPYNQWRPIWGQMSVHEGPVLQAHVFSTTTYSRCSSATLLKRHCREHLPPTGYLGFLQWVFRSPRANPGTTVFHTGRFLQVRGACSYEEVLPQASGQGSTSGPSAHDHRTSYRTARPVSHRDASVLFDLGSTYSYVSSLFSPYLDVSCESLGVPIFVSTPVGDSIVVDQVYRSRVVTFYGYETGVNLLLLDMTVFELILGMDWLSPYHVVLDYHAKTVTLMMPKLPRLEWRGSSIITSSREFSNVFPFDLPGMKSSIWRQAPSLSLFHLIV